MTRTINEQAHGGKFTGYDWPATLELLMHLDNANHRRFKMILCPFCNSVHEPCSKCPSSLPRYFRTPATANS